MQTNIKTHACATTAMAGYSDYVKDHYIGQFRKYRRRAFGTFIGAPLGFYLLTVTAVFITLEDSYALSATCKLVSILVGIFAFWMTCRYDAIIDLIEDGVVHLSELVGVRTVAASTNTTDLQTVCRMEELEVRISVVVDKLNDIFSDSLVGTVCNLFAKTEA